jgi:outer membrane protein TolC
MSGCVSTGQTLPLNSAPPITLASHSTFVPIKSSSDLVQAILQIPSVSQSLAVARVAQSQVAISQSEKAFKVQATGSTGINSESNDSTEGAIILGVTAEKLLYDNGQTDRSIFVTQLAANTATLEAQIFIDQTLQKVVDAYLARATSSNIADIIGHYIDRFNMREALVTMAVKAGVLSNLDYLELQALKNEILSEKAQAELRFKTSNSFLKATFGGYFDNALLELESKYKALKVPTLSINQAFSMKILGLRARQLRTKINIQKMQENPTVKWQTSISSPKSSSNGTTVFAGITLGVPLKDGGESVARVEALLTQLEAIGLETDTLEQRANLAEQGLNDFLVYQKKQKGLLLERQRISEERTDELELRIRTGRSDISLLAKQLLTTAKIEIALEQLNYEHLSQILSAVAVTGQTCQLINLCQAISLGIPQ